RGRPRRPGRAALPDPPAGPGAGDGLLRTHGDDAHGRSPGPQRGPVCPDRHRALDARARRPHRGARRGAGASGDRGPSAPDRAAGPVNTLMRELSGIADLWYGPCVLEPGVLTTVHGLQATPWAEAI